MASRTCGWCGRVAHMQRAGYAGQAVPTDIDPTPSEATVSGAYQCAHCGRASIGYRDYPSGWLTNYSSNDLYELLDDRETHWLPRRGSAPQYPDVPKHVAAAAVEAHECHSIGANRSAVQMARAVIDATAKAKGITKGRLIEKIDQLEEQRIIRPTVAAGCHEVRHLGNDMAHGDFTAPVTAEEADEVLVLMGILLHDVFQAEARVNRMRTAREARKEQPASTTDSQT